MAPAQPHQPDGDQATGSCRHRDAATGRDTVLPAGLCVLGLGLIGGSLLRAGAEHLPTFGWSPSETTRAAASADGFEVLETLDEALDRAASMDALVVLASPITAFGPLLSRIDARTPRALLTDVGSVKGPVAEQVATLAPTARYIGSHPMAGTAQSGWAAGTADLFAGSAWVTCLRQNRDIDAWAQVAGLALAVGCRVVPVEAAAHDDAVARISHLPHLLALALAQVGMQGGSLALSLAASSFADGTRVAGTRPELVRAMCEANSRPLASAMDEALALLGIARASLASTGSLTKITEGGHRARIEFERRGTGLEPVTLDGADLIEQLLSMGLAGGHVTGVERAEGGYRISATYPADSDDPSS